MSDNEKARAEGEPTARVPFIPGPWVVFDEKDRYPGIDGPDGTCTIVTWGDETDTEAGVRGPTHEIALANARLVAAAPELYEALLDALREADECRPRKSPETGIIPRPHFMWRERARAALAKAQGNAPQAPKASP